MEDHLSDAVEFEKRFSTEEACREYLVQLRWPEGFCCTHCGGRKGWRIGDRQFECCACGRQASLTAGTIFHGCRKPLGLWFRAVWYLISQKTGVSALELQRTLGLHSYQTAWTWLHRLRRAMRGPGQDPLSGSIELATIWLWGMPDFGCLRRAKGLVVIAAEADGQGIGRIRMRAIRYASTSCLQLFVQDSIAPGSTLFTSDWDRYDALEQKGYQRELYRGKLRDFSSLPRVDWVTARLKQWLLGTHRGAVSQAHLADYLDEFTFRFNARKCKNREDLFFQLVQRAVSTTPIPYSVLGKHSRFGR